jgi:glycyl-tRNA synthetase
MFLAVMSNSLVNEVVPGSDDPNNTRDVLKIPPALAPVKCAILPLKRNEEAIVNKAKDIFNQLKLSFHCQYDDTGSIGKLYRRQDAIGTPFCITVDFESLEDNMVTIRDRDTLKQERVSIEKVAEIVGQKVDMKNILA